MPSVDDTMPSWDNTMPSLDEPLPSWDEPPPSWDDSIPSFNESPNNYDMGLEPNSPAAPAPRKEKEKAKNERKRKWVVAVPEKETLVGLNQYLARFAIVTTVVTLTVPNYLMMAKAKISEFIQGFTTKKE